MAALVIIGGGLAGAKAAESARQSGYQGRVIVVGAEAHAPYERPPLSKAILRGEADLASANVHADDFYDEHDIEVLSGVAVTSIDPDARRVHLDGDTLEFDRAILATGASPRSLDVPGAALEGVHHLRTLDDAVAIRAAVREGGRVAVIGAGWIGSEVAASARQMGADVVLIDPARAPLQRVVGDEVGRLFSRLHADHGVTLRLGSGVSELRGGGSVEEVVLTDGRVEAADVVIVGIGVVPNVALAELAGLATANGIVVDQFLEATGTGIYAAGDVASAYHPHYRSHLRVEHWATALNQGVTAGRNAAGATESYERLPYFFSDQYDLGLEYVGHGQADDAVVIRGDAADLELIAFWLREGRVTAAMNVNVWDVVEDLKAIVGSTKRADPGRLADPSVPLDELA